MREAGQRRITSADVARASGVSRATVSYVLNNDPRQSITLETRERVLKAAQTLGYYPSTAARILRMGHSPIVLAVLPFEQIDPALARKLKNLQVHLAAYGLTLLCHFGLQTPGGTAYSSLNVTPGVVLSYANEKDPIITAFLRQFHVPVLSMLGSHTHLEKIGEMQAAHLLQRGKHRLLYAASERGRLEGVQRECERNGLEPPPTFVVPSSREEGQVLIRTLLAKYPLPWGICCYNDEIAFAVLAALADEGIEVPADAAVIGCDNIPLAPFSMPPLTTIRFDLEESLDPLVEMIISASQGKPIGEVPLTTCSLVARASA